MLVVKPELSEKQKQLANQLWEYMKLHEYCTRKQLCEALGWPYNDSNDRKTRELISILASKKPVISTSHKNSGYKLARHPGDLEEVKHTWMEIDSRIAELNKRKAPLIKFYEENGGNSSPLH